jgi:hypothetical protein
MLKAIHRKKRSLNVIILGKLSVGSFHGHGDEWSIIPADNIVTS